MAGALHQSSSENRFQNTLRHFMLTHYLLCLCFVCCSYRAQIGMQKPVTMSKEPPALMTRNRMPMVWQQAAEVWHSMGEEWCDKVKIMSVGMGWQ